MTPSLLLVPHAPCTSHAFSVSVELLVCNLLSIFFFEKSFPRSDKVGTFSMFEPERRVAQGRPKVQVRESCHRFNQ